MTLGRPVICSDRSSIPEVVGDAGEYFNPDHPESIARAIEAVVYSSARTTALMAAGRQRVALFTRRRCAQGHPDVYRSLVNALNFPSMRTQILYLYLEIQSHNLPVLARLASSHGALVDVIRWNRDKLTPFTPADMPGVRFHERSAFDERQLMAFALELKPKLVYVSGWMDRGYLPVARLKAQGSIIVTGMDSQWTGLLRQQIVAKWVHWQLRKHCFSYAWVPGPMQYEFARRIGFRKSEILAIRCPEIPAFSGSSTRTQ